MDWKRPERHNDYYNMGPGLDPRTEKGTSVQEMVKFK